MIVRLSALLALTAALAGCGLSPNSASRHVTLAVTRDFGHTLVTSGQAAAPSGDETALDLLRAGAQVRTAPSGQIESIDGIANAAGASWSYWVNGQRPSTAPGSYRLTAGDTVQFDYHGGTSPQAIVGAYPNPFLQGLNGKRSPVDVECESDSSSACQTVRNRLSSAGIVAGGSAFGAGGSGIDSVRVIVGRWAALRSLATFLDLERGPAKSGIYASLDPSGRLSLYGPGGNRLRAAPPGSGLIAAVEPRGQGYIWAVTGADDAGVSRAAEALDSKTLARAFAVVATPAGVLRLPVSG